VPGGYFQLAAYRHYSEIDDVAFARQLAQDWGVAVVPVSAFYHDGYDPGLVRFCFAKELITLEMAAGKLRR
jgi:methionine aminotransferase